VVGVQPVDRELTDAVRVALGDSSLTVHGSSVHSEKVVVCTLKRSAPANAALTDVIPRALCELPADQRAAVQTAACRA
jgi:hypothetical protein